MLSYGVIPSLDVKQFPISETKLTKKFKDGVDSCWFYLGIMKLHLRSLVLRKYRTCWHKWLCPDNMCHLHNILFIVVGVVTAEIGDVGGGGGKIDNVGRK